MSDVNWRTMPRKEKCLRACASSRGLREVRVSICLLKAVISSENCSKIFFTFGLIGRTITIRLFCSERPSSSCDLSQSHGRGVAPSSPFYSIIAAAQLSPSVPHYKSQNSLGSVERASSRRRSRGSPNRSLTRSVVWSAALSLSLPLSGQNKHSTFSFYAEERRKEGRRRRVHEGST